MEIRFTEEAKTKLEEQVKCYPGTVLELYYDIDDCGCVVNGVTELRLVEKAEETEGALQTNYLPVFLEKKYQVFFDDEMTIDFVKKYSCFQLKSPNQMLNPRMRFINNDQSALR
ncbi:iron-sulfur cluster biosynthesis family protein [Pseudalkalibacillus caeni]|uniref:Iron-sulfur cluster biosynthesis family protein n=1 Tax=Exobacillus caeni TaxID=2574798 RepID=A0A5R9EZQ0_9BACL|nr:iron-sulfur cluster biosynthesis family protein [Pseudalkalibacillus caeni]TLS35676.1 iron-sulfur cluster biosynthesis family protein [Pseudalkalibacillus caeni]